MTSVISLTARVYQQIRLASVTVLGIPRPSGMAALDLGFDVAGSKINLPGETASYSSMAGQTTIAPLA
jgi:hypothetical protein